LVEERGQEAAAKLKAKGYEVEAAALDVAKGGVCSAVARRVVQDYGRIDALVNNAGLFILSRSEDLSEHDWRLQIDVMLTGVFLMTQAVAREAMIPQRSGSIVNIASIGGMGGWPMRSAYNAAKAGVIALTEVLATEWGQYDIRVNSVSPGVTRTEMLEVAISQGLASAEGYAQRAPLRRIGDVQDIANAVLFLASDKARFVTGVNLRVDGGWVPWENLRGEGFP
jgi:NAD(P)-dependent dehydrogenase (short-subunit alcohol dehydrogenase family)